MVIISWMQEIQDFNVLLNTYRAKAQCINYQKCDNYSFYDLQLSPGGKIKEISQILGELALGLKTPFKPHLRLITGHNLIRLEIPLSQAPNLNLFDYFTNSNIPNYKLPVLLGKTTDNQRVWMDLVQNPHLLVSGTTNSGKSSLLHNIIANLYNYSHVNLVLIDPKQIEFFKYEKLKNTNISYSYQDSLYQLDLLNELMDQRYSLIREGIDNFPYVVVIIDEFADLIMQDEENTLYKSILRLAQRSRAAKIHLILATQRPSIDIISGAIKANFPARIACKVASAIDSKVILDTSGAESLRGNGDALIKDNYRHLERFQIAYTSPTEVCTYFGN